MRVTRDDGRRLVIVDYPLWIGAVMFPAAAVCVVRAVTELARGRRDKGAWIGALIGAALFFLAGTLFTKRSEFAFDFVTKQLAWRRRGLFTRAAGVVPLAEVREAFVQINPSRDNGMPMYRLAVRTDGGVVPLTDAFDTDEVKPNRVRDRINAALNVTATDPAQLAESAILELALAGQKIEAIKLARLHYGYELAEAKAFVEGLSK